MSDDEKALTPHEDIVLASKVLHEAQQGDLVWGHVSVREETGRGAWLKGSHLGFDEVTTDDVVLLGWDGEVLEGTAKRHLEWPIHIEILKARPDVGGVVHTHPKHSIAFAATGFPLKPLSHEGCCFVPPDIPRFTETGAFVRTAELGQKLAECLGDRNAALMPCHGIVTVGPDLGSAVALATNLERACEIQLLAGKDAVGSDDEEAIFKRQDMLRTLPMHWQYRYRRVGTDANRPR